MEIALLYIVIALKAEAQAFVDRYKLKKSKLHHYTHYSNDAMHLIISGMGVNNSREATQSLINEYDMDDADIFLNVGICAADKSYEIGSLLEIGIIHYNEMVYTFNENAQEIYCIDTPASDDAYKIADMESFGFYDAVLHNPAIKNFQIFKVVSDHFEPEKVSKELAKKLLFNKIDAINELIFTKDV